MGRCQVRVRVVQMLNHQVNCLSNTDGWKCDAFVPLPFMFNFKIFNYESEEKIMAKKIMVKNMDFVSLSDYNVASFEIIRLSAEKSNELAPLREERKKILEERAKALEKEGAVLDEVLRNYSIDDVERRISAVNEKYKAPLAECAKAQNKVLKLVNPNTFYAYAIAMDSTDSVFNATGEFVYTKNNGDVERVKVGAKDTFYQCIKSLYDDLGAFGTDDKKAMDKLIKFHAKRVGGLKFDRKTQDNVLKKKTEVVNALIRDIIKYLEVRGVIEVADNGAITKVEKKVESVA